MTKKTATLSIHRPQACRLLAVSDRTFARLEAEGVIESTVPRRGRRAATFDAFVLVPAYLAHVEKKLHGDRINVERQRARRDKTIADLNERKLAVQAGQLVAREQAIREGQSVMLAFRARVIALARLLVQRGLVTADRQADVKAICLEMLTEMSRWRAADVEALTTKERETQGPPSHRRK